ncbi:hypothetical protein [Pedobacter sp. MW01-1-1]|uniref:hypothetical protein n=1 Tax=Pedobacter sp. MW01-1-1 TaxID=3383027 RepID=UPI003FF04530
MSAKIYTVLKEYYVEIHDRPIKARILSQVNRDNVFVFQTSAFYKNRNHAEPHEPVSTFTSFANAERHLFQYLEEFQNTLDLGGEVTEGNRF